MDSSEEKTAKKADGLFRLDEHTDPRLRNQILLDQMSLPLTDRERARLYGLPEGCRIRERAKILAPEKFSCGRYVWIGEGAILDAQGGLTVGDYTQIGSHVFVWSHESHRQALHGQTCISKKGITYKPTRIGSHCYIPGPSVIAPGVTLGNRVIVSPLTFVDQDVPDNTVIGGHREIRDLEKRIQHLEEMIAKMLTLLGSPQGQSVDGLKEIMTQLLQEPYPKKGL